MQQTIDPYTMLQLPRNYTVEMLRANYKRLALQLHPDRNNPTTTAMFQILTNCYKTLLKEWQLRQQEKPHSDMRQQSQDYIQEQVQQPHRRSDMEESDKFNLDKFNRVFSDHRISDAYQEGYDGWLRGQPDTEAARVKNQHVVVYKTPQALPAANNTLPFYELGVDRIADHTPENLMQSSLPYMDLVRAHTTDRLVDPNNVKARKNYRTVQELESDRASAPSQLTDSELRALKRAQIKQEKTERARQERLQQLDQVSYQNYLRVHKLMLGVGPQP